MNIQKQELIDEIERLKGLLKKEEEKEALSAHIHPDHKEIAELLHKHFCGHNRTDGCDWLYDVGDWTQYSRQLYLKRAGFLLRKFEKEDCLYIIRSLTS